MYAYMIVFNCSAVVFENCFDYIQTHIHKYTSTL